MTEHHPASVHFLNERKGDPEPVKDEKYVVLKRSELQQLLDELYGGEAPAWAINDVEAYGLNDATVIRTRDVFAGPALHSYAYTIRLVADATSDEPRKDQLAAVADYFADRAREADEIHYSGQSKYPQP